MRGRIWIVGLLAALVGCVQTGEPRFKPDYAEAARLNTQLGRDYLSQGRIDLAQSKFQKALAQDNGLAGTHLGMALVHQHYEEWQQADEAFRRAQKLAPKDAEILTLYGAYLCERKSLAASEALFRQALATARNSAPEVTLTVAAQCYLEQGEPERAEDALLQALQRQPRHGPALLEMARLAYTTEDYLRARAFSQRFEALKVDNAESLLLALRIELALGERSEAQRLAQRLQALVPGIEASIDLATGKAWEK